MIVVWLALVGCGGGNRVTGEVLDVAGAPVEDAVVTAVGTLCQDQTDQAGHFELSCNPSELLITVTQTGYISKEIEVEVEAGRHDLGRVTLIAVPKKHGLFLFTGSDYTSMQPGVLLKTTGPRKKARTYCIDADASPPNAVPAGTVAMFDNEYGDWRVWRVDDGGCAYRMSVGDNGRWQTDFAEKPSQEAHTVETEKEVVMLDLQPGSYFVADWANGFFVKKRGERDRYTGYLLVAQ